MIKKKLLDWIYEILKVCSHMSVGLFLAQADLFIMSYNESLGFMIFVNSIFLFCMIIYKKKFPEEFEK